MRKIIAFDVNVDNIKSMFKELFKDEGIVQF